MNNLETTIVQNFYWYSTIKIYTCNNFSEIDLLFNSHNMKKAVCIASWHMNNLSIDIRN